MPFASEAQRRLLWALHPDIAKRWASEFPGQKNLPYHVKPRHAQKRLVRRAREGR